MSAPAEIPLTRGHLFTLANEGKRYQTYDDKTGETIAANGRGVHTGKELQGTLTIGVGHTGDDFKAGDIWSEFQVMTVFKLDYHKALEEAYELARSMPWQAMGIARQAVVTDMAFEMGKGGLSKFLRMWSAIKQSDWTTASLEIALSHLAAQSPVRVALNVAMMKLGEWQ